LLRVLSILRLIPEKLRLILEELARRTSKKLALKIKNSATQGRGFPDYGYSFSAMGTTPQATLALYLWLPICLFLFVRYPAQRAVIIGFIAAWQFLPMDKIYLSPLPVYDKMAAACYGILLGTLLFDLERITTFTPSWIDIPALIFCFCPAFSQIENGLSPISPTFDQVVSWGAPYLIGRLYFNNLESFRRLAIGIISGALVYIPFAFIEFGMGPLLHEKVYGFPAFVDWSQARRFGGWRPVLFMQHGLMVAAWMMVAALSAIWLWYTKAVKTVLDKPIKPIAIFIFLIFLNCRSTGAWLLAVVGLALLFTAPLIRSSILVLLLSGVTMLYLVSGVMGTTPVEGILQALAFTGDKVNSLAFRLVNEEILGDQARKKILFGWGDSGNHTVYDSGGRQIITDSLWIILFGFNGAVGLFSWATMMLIPVVRFCSVYPAKLWKYPKVAPAAVLAVCLNLYVVDCLLNAMINPVFTLIAGGLSSLAVQPAENHQETKRESLPSAVVADESEVAQTPPRSRPTPISQPPSRHRRKRLANFSRRR
jgi:hypothetical protein